MKLKSHYAEMAKIFIEYIRPKMKGRSWATDFPFKDGEIVELVSAKISGAITDRQVREFIKERFNEPA